MKTEIATVYLLGPWETALVCGVLIFLTVFVVMSVKTDPFGEIVGLDFSWIKHLFNRRKEKS